MSHSPSILFSLPVERLLDLIAERIKPVIKTEIESLNLKAATTETSYLTRQQVAQKLNITPQTVKVHVLSGKLKAYRVGRRVLFKSEEVENSLKSIVIK
jgi:excisionase family DNA binding protein